MSFTIQDIMNLTVPPRVARVTVAGDTAAQKSAAARQGQFQSIDADTPIAADAGSQKIRIRCVLTDARGRVDSDGVLQILIAASQVLSAPTVVGGVGTLLGAGILGTNGVVYARPSALGAVDITVTLAAAGTAAVTLMNRSLVSSTATVTIA